MILPEDFDYCEFTYEELKENIDSTTIDETWYMLPTFDMYVLSKMKKGDTVIINYTENTFEIK